MFKFPDHVFVVAEIGINHNGSLARAMDLIDVAVEAGCDAVKFQKRTPAMSLPAHLWDVERDTPWGMRMTYLEYRQRIELSSVDYIKIVEYCRELGIIWFASPWDCNAASTLWELGIPLYKIPSAAVVNIDLLKHVAGYGLPVIMSTGMASYEEVHAAVKIFSKVPRLALLVCTSNYPVCIEDLNLRRIHTLQELYPELVIGYSGHEAGLWTTLCAVAMGARVVERHITLDRSLPGTDQASSVEPQGLKKLVKEIRNFEKALGDGNLGVLPCEAGAMKRLRP